MARDAISEFRRMARRLPILVVLTALAALPVPGHAVCSLSIDLTEAAVLAERIWGNESGRDADKILWWNPGENFASLGIGHFIWYPPGIEGPFEESFPELLAFLSSRNVAMPAWLARRPAPDCPWLSREQFFDERDGPKAAELRRLLLDSTALQAQFMLARLESALDAMLAAAPASSTRVMTSRFCALASLPAGRYALMDYVNFKGEGTNVEERYAGEGWGLLQALEEMRGTQPVNADFADAAARVLERRVRNAPAERREQRWLPGWKRRVDSYRHD